MSELSGPVSAMLELYPMLMLIIIGGLGVSFWLSQETKVSSIAIPLFLVFISILLFPGIANTLRGIQSGDDLVSQPEEAEFNFTLISKGIEYEKGFLGPKKRYVLILSDGEKYSVPRDVYEMFDTGDSVTITISANRQKVTFSGLS